MTTLIIIIVAALLLLLLTGNKSKTTTNQPKPQTPSRPPLTDAEHEAIRQADEAWDWATHNAIVAGTYSGPLPEHIAGGHWSSLYPDIYHTSVAGINFRRGIKDLAGTTFDATLTADPKNKYDPNAIKIVHASDGRHLGFIPADETASVRQFLSDTLPHPCRVHIDEGEEDDDETGRTRHFLIGEVNIYRNSSTTLSPQ